MCSKILNIPRFAHNLLGRCVYLRQRTHTHKLSLYKYLGSRSSLSCVPFPFFSVLYSNFTSPLIYTMSVYKDQDPRLHGIKTKIRVVPNFPKSGSFSPYLIFSFFFFVFFLLYDYFGPRKRTTSDSSF